MSNQQRYRHPIPVHPQVVKKQKMGLQLPKHLLEDNIDYKLNVRFEWTCNTEHKNTSICEESVFPMVLILVSTRKMTDEGNILYKQN